MSAPAVSVIIPTYRHGDLVEETLASVFAQTFTDFEIIVVNDGSPDDTAARLRPLADTGRVRYLEQPNAGQAAARGRGFAEARGEFIAFLDDDDLWPADKLDWQVAALRAHPDWVMVSGPAGLLEPGNVRTMPAVLDGSVTMQSVEAMFEGNGINSPGQVLIRRDAFVAVAGFDRELWGVDDADLWIRLAARGPAAQIARVALIYRLHGSNASHAAARMFWNAVRMIRKNLPLVPARNRLAVRRSAIQNLYVYAGRRVVRAARGGGPTRWWDALSVLAFLLPSMLRDSSLARLVASDIVPDWARPTRGSATKVPTST